MSFFDYLFDSEWSQRSDIETLKARGRQQQMVAARNSRQNTSKVNDLEAKVIELQEEVGALQLITRGLLEILKDSPDWDDKKFKDTLLELDLEDGNLDGKISSPVSEKPKPKVKIKDMHKVKVKKIRI